MLKALAIKELRESAAILALACLVMLYLLGGFLGWQFMPGNVVHSVAYTIPFVSNGFVEILIGFGGVLAIALGLKQGAWENSSKQYYFLLHRPVSRHTVFLTKMALGLGLLFLLTAGPILIYANWAATPGNHASPFFWGMTTTAWRVCWALPSVYLGALLSGLRPARWLGTRLLPLVGTCTFTFMLGGIWSEYSSVLGITGLIGLDLVLFRLILATAQKRDY